MPLVLLSKEVHPLDAQQSQTLNTELCSEKKSKQFIGRVPSQKKGERGFEI